MNAPQPMAQPAPGKKPRDLRLDFFRGLAMFIILLAHTPGNTWTLWIPARFGFSDATEIFVFCSGMASALAFGAVFAKKSWLLGLARVLFRVWQVYWAHIGVFLVTAVMLFAIDHYDVGARERPYIQGPWVVPFFTQTGEAMIGLLTLTWVPGLFDILPMYLVILAMIPMVMGCHRIGGRPAVAVFILGLWCLATLAGFARKYGGEEDVSAIAASLAAMGEPFLFLNLPSNPFGNGTWFFNPFAWQLIFFTGFSFGMGWLPAPPVRRWLVILCAAYVLLIVPFAWFQIHRGNYLPADWALTEWIVATRDWAQPFWWKTWAGLGRFTHFLALAYLGWVAVGVGGARLREGFRPVAAAARPVLIVAGIVLVLTLPYAYVEEIKLLAPALDAWLLTWVPIVPAPRMGLVQIAHLVALVMLVWWAVGEAARHWLARDGFLKAVPVIRKVGTQSLAVFMVSIPLSRFDGWLLDMVGRDVWTRAGINLFGFAVLIATAYLVGWLKTQPWRDRPAAKAPAAPATGPGVGALAAPRS